MASNFGRNKNVASSGLSFGHPCLKDKLLIVNDLETGKKMQASICRERDLPKSTIATIWANRSKLKNSVEDGASSSRRKGMRGVFHMYTLKST